MMTDSTGDRTDTPALPGQRYDAEADASYLHLNEGGGVEFASTVCLSDSLNIDLDQDRRVIGIEKVGGRIEADDLIAVIRHVRWERS